MDKKNPRKHIRKKAVGVSGLLIVTILLTMSSSVVGPSTDESPFLQQHFGHDFGIDMPNGENVGIAYFVDRWGENTDGLTWETAFNTIQQAVDAATDGAGDYIYVRGGHNYEPVVVNKNNIHIIGEGTGSYTTCWNILIVANNVELAGFFITTYESGFGIQIGQWNMQRNSVHIHDNEFNINRGDKGIIIETGYDHRINNNIFDGISWDTVEPTVGIDIPWSCIYGEISGNTFRELAVGIRMIGDEARANYNKITDNVFWTEMPHYHPPNAYIGIQLNGIGNFIANNYFGGYWENILGSPIFMSAPVIDESTWDSITNTYLDNHWGKWSYWQLSYSGSGNSGLIPVVFSLDIPSEGKVKVRMDITFISGFDPGSGDTIELFMYDWSMQYLYDYYLYPDPWLPSDVGTQFSPYVESSISGGANQITICVRFNSAGSMNCNYDLEIIDA